MNTTFFSGLWDTEDGFYYDDLRELKSDGSTRHHTLSIRSMVGLVPLFAATKLKRQLVEKDDEIKNAIHKAMKDTEFVSGVFSIMILILN